MKGSAERFPELFPFGTAPVVFDSFFAVWYDQILLVHLVHFPPQTWNQPFLQAALISFREKWYFQTIVWTLGMLTATRLFLVSRHKIKIHNNKNTKDRDN